MEVLYEDNHIIIVNKAPGEIVQGDKTGDEPLCETLKQYIKERDAKPGNVFMGVVHRLDRPVGGVVVFAKTSKALARLNEMFRNGDVHKTYWAITRNRPPKTEDTLTHYITTVERNNKSYASLTPKKDAKEARLSYRLIASSDRYHLLEVNLMTGRKHQIRVQLSSIGCPIKGDLKYGDKRSNPDGSISLMARHIQFIHPVSKKQIDVTAPVPDDNLWHALEQNVDNSQDNTLNINE
jgi:23S rRNA pseudouridine1911/1915/1917 synthase